MGLFNNDGDLLNFSEGENPSEIYEVEWDNLHNPEDLLRLLKAIPNLTFNVDFSGCTVEEGEVVLDLINKKILKELGS